MEISMYRTAKDLFAEGDRQRLRGDTASAFETYRKALVTLVSARKLVDKRLEYRLYEEMVALAQKYTPIAEELSRTAARDRAPPPTAQSTATRPGVRWTDVVGNEEAKQMLMEAVVLPLTQPQLFAEGTGRRQWGGVLLYGPPGTGKTMLARAAAGTRGFFEIKPSLVLDKYIGESEKNIRAVFEKARSAAPSIVFIDEVDAFSRNRSDGGGGSNADRRVLTELLEQLNDPGGVFVIAATNVPWDVDEAFRRRLERHIYVGLPAAAERAAMFRSLLAGVQNTLTDKDYVEIARQTERFSGSDIAGVVRGATMYSTRARFFRQMPDGTYVPAKEGEPGARAMLASEVPQGKLAAPRVTFADLVASRATITPSVSAETIRRFEEYGKKHIN